MSSIEGLLRAYEEFVRIPWDSSLAGPQRVWFAVYDPQQERRLRLRYPDFEDATLRAGHGWTRLDLTDAFARWMVTLDYRDAYFAQPDDLAFALEDFAATLTARVRDRLTAPDVDANTVVTLSGLASLFGLARVSALIESVAPAIRGRLLGFFPGEHHGSGYRLLDARDGWNYLAVPITATEER